MGDVRADPDFAAYVVARWLPVVRVLVVLGHPVDRAEDVAVASFARLLPDWGRLRREDDVDVELARVVLDGWVRTRGREPAPQVPVRVPAARVMTQELEDQLALLDRLVAGPRLSSTTRPASPSCCTTSASSTSSRSPTCWASHAPEVAPSPVRGRDSSRHAAPRPCLPLGRERDRRAATVGGARAGPRERRVSGVGGW